jgi:hypothetical protein
LADPDGRPFSLFEGSGFSDWLLRELALHRIIGMSAPVEVAIRKSCATVSPSDSRRADGLSRNGVGTRVVTTNSQRQKPDPSKEPKGRPPEKAKALSALRYGAILFEPESRSRGQKDASPVLHHLCSTVFFVPRVMERKLDLVRTGVGKMRLLIPAALAFGLLCYASVKIVSMKSIQRLGIRLNVILLVFSVLLLAIWFGMNSYTQPVSIGEHWRMVSISLAGFLSMLLSIIAALKNRVGWISGLVVFLSIGVGFFHLLNAIASIPLS